MPDPSNKKIMVKVKKPLKKTDPTKDSIGSKKIDVKNLKKTINETATRKDSLDVYNSGNQRASFYEKAGYKKERTRPFDKEKLNQNDIDERSFKSVKYNEDKPITNVIRNGVSKQETLNTSDYVKKIDKHKYAQRDNVTKDVNLDAPMGLKDSRIQPKETITYTKGTDIATIETYYKPSDKKPTNKNSSKPKIMVKVKRKTPIKKVNKTGSNILKKGSYLN